MSHCTLPPRCIGESDMCSCACSPCAALRREAVARDRWLVTANAVRTMMAESLRFQEALRRIADQARIDVLGEQLLGRIAIEALQDRQ